MRKSKTYIVEAGDNWINCPEDSEVILGIWNKDSRCFLHYAKDSTDIPGLCGEHNPHDWAQPLCWYETHYCERKSLHFYPYPKDCISLVVHYLPVLESKTLLESGFSGIKDLIAMWESINKEMNNK